MTLETISRSISSLPGGDSDFDLVLQGRLDAFKPLEMVVLQHLLRVMESILSIEPSEKTDLFPPRPIPTNAPPQFSPIENPVKK